VDDHSGGVDRPSQPCAARGRKLEFDALVQVAWIRACLNFFTRTRKG